jgi:hypothetical protein
MLANSHAHTWLLSLLITEGHHWVALPMSHSPNPHTHLLNVFIQIANKKKKRKEVSIAALVNVGILHLLLPTWDDKDLRLLK